MAVDSSLLYGEMVGSWIIHLAIPVGVSMIFGALPFIPMGQKLPIMIGIIVVISFLTQMGFLTALQASTCKGVKNYTSIAKGASIGAVITAIMVAIPVYIEGLRLPISQLISPHRSLLTPAVAQMESVIADASKQFYDASVQKGGAALTPEEYESQTFKEITIGASYWTAFAGAYGIGVGSLLAGKCS
jgi:hypothetical protein